MAENKSLFSGLLGGESDDSLIFIILIIVVIFFLFGDGFGKY
ncbi:hypothetical protein [Proteiniborus sp. MB09-C3]|nr:hypothetical protein [Proteiniborus sp. MB09-C3]WIV10433.1 hypothetical protein QO263_09685 [Proteiniborus sp. MB09-C3]